MFTIALYFSSVAASAAQPYPDRTVPIPSWMPTSTTSTTSTASTTSTTSAEGTTRPTVSLLECEFMNVNNGCPEGQKCSISGICVCSWMEQTGCPVGQVCSIGSVCGEPWSPPETTRPTDATCQEEFDTSAALNDAGAQSDCEELDGCTWTADSGPFSETNKGTCVTTETSFLFSAARRDAGPARRPPTPRVGNDAMTMSVVVAALLTL
eukprot:GEMP01055886.1.p1 GENE.GEMP01055886.1~~GEMP01055886.1.p1  ORF type:complete len:209 (+),score=52.60 GEMP01055886.1:141-767(+)